MERREKAGVGPYYSEESSYFRSRRTKPVGAGMGATMTGIVKESYEFNIFLRKFVL